MLQPEKAKANETANDCSEKTISPAAAWIRHVRTHAKNCSNACKCRISARNKGIKSTDVSKNHEKYIEFPAKYIDNPTLILYSYSVLFN